MALSQITPSLYLGGADVAVNGSMLSRVGITLIVNATVTLAPAVHPGVACVRVPVSDLPSARIDCHFESVSRLIHENGGKTLIHCAAGVSRSPALVMAYLMRFKGNTLRQAHALVRDRRPNIRPNRGFWEQLLEYERRLYGKNTVRLLAGEEEASPRNGPITTQNTSPMSPLTRRLATDFKTPSSSGSRQLAPELKLTTRLTTNLKTPHLSRPLTTAPAPQQVAVTPRLRNRKCLLAVPKSPLATRRQNQK